MCLLQYQDKKRFRKYCYVKMWDMWYVLATISGQEKKLLKIQIHVLYVVKMCDMWCVLATISRQEKLLKILTCGKNVWYVDMW
jgi:hypothetical protein